MSIVAIVVSCVLLFGQLVAGQCLFDLALWFQYGGEAVPPNLNLYFAELSFMATICRGWFLVGKHFDKPEFRKVQSSDIPANVWIAFVVFLPFLLFLLWHVLHHA